MSGSDRERSKARRRALPEPVYKSEAALVFYAIHPGDRAEAAQ